MSTTGEYIYSVGYAGGFYKSSSFGSNWVLINPVSTSYTDVATDETGNYVALSVDDSFIYLSNNYGENSSPTNFPMNKWTAISMSSNGSIIAAVASYGYSVNSNSLSSGYVYLSYDYGESLATSSTGLSMIGINGSVNDLTISLDYANTFTSQGLSLLNNYKDVTVD
eukprot:gene10851-14547_t